MRYGSFHAMQEENSSVGRLRVTVNSSVQHRPIEDAKVSISYTGDPSEIIEELVTNSAGETEELELPTPPLEYSLEPEQFFQPYSEYTIRVTAPDREPVEIDGTQVLPDELALQNVYMESGAQAPPEAVVIPPHTLYYEYPPKIPEAEIKPMEESGEIVLSRVVIPEFVVVHDGPPDDPGAENHYVRYRDYIKNVASSEIYATWPDDTIRANILAIMSFTLNRVYTEWYRNRGLQFTITSSTVYDHKWINGRNFFEKISEITDQVFPNYLSRPNVRQPILAQYCDGQRVQCPNAMSQWGSKYLGDQNYSTIDILRYYYGDDMYINTAEEVSGVPASWPGSNLEIGASGGNVTKIQEQLNTIGEVYSNIKPIMITGIYEEATQQAVRQFQETFHLPVTGIVDYRTWYRIQEIYVAVTRIAELI